MTRIPLGCILAALAWLPAPAAAQAQAPTGEALLTQAASQTTGEAGHADLLTALGVPGVLPASLGVRAVVGGIPGTQVEGNTAVIEQVGGGNKASITQEGRRNVAAVYEDGSFNDVDATQIGSDNVFGAWLVGSFNDLSVTQQGTNNYYYLGFTGANLQHTVTQIGNGLRAIQIGVGSVPFGIQQTGNGAEVIITHNPVVP